MEQFRVNFQREHRVEWSYMTPEVIQEYLDFKHSQDVKFMRESLLLVKPGVKTIQMSIISDNQRLLMTSDSQRDHNADIMEMINEKRRAPKLM